MAAHKEHTNHLLLIAIDQYEDEGISALKHCIADARQLKDILHHKYFFSPAHTTELYGPDAGCDELHKVFKKYVSELTEADNLVIYFSGHGHYDPDIDRGYWIPWDARVDTPKSYFSNPDLLDYIKKIDAFHIVLISDSCFSRSILTEYTEDKAPKNVSSLYNAPSRWALSSGQYTVFEQNGFAETIRSLLNSAEKDVLISDLIQAVKNKFLTSEEQMPQGTPLKDMHHHAGEFIFKIKEVEQEDEKAFKVHKDALKILQLYNRKTKFKEMWRVEEGNSKSKVGYIVFLEKNEVIKKDFFYLFLYQGANLTETHQHLEKHYPQIFQLGNLIVLLPKEKDRKRHEIRIKIVTEKFKPLSAFYIDDFIREECSPQFFADQSGSKYLEISNFIMPTVKISDGEGTMTQHESFDDTALSPLKRWFENEETPILVVKGGGGIGKTTLARYISDKFIQSNKKSQVIFIESKVIVSRLTRQSDDAENESITLYDFYAAATPDTGERMNKDVFRLNFDAGNLLIVIDGLDEIIANVRKFNAEEFLKSIEKFTDDINDGKLIITCRSYFWEANKYTSSLIQSIEILPFNKEQTLKFFKASFPDDDKKVDKCMEMAEEFSFPSSEDVKEYQPYALDIVRLIVSSQRELLMLDASFNSDILEQKNKRDYILFRICNRELERTQQISVDEQIRFFTHLAVARRGTVKADNFKQEIDEALGKKINDTNIEAFKGHPLLQKTGANFRFKYDFFIDYFRNIYLSSFLKYDSPNAEVTPDFVSILAESCWFGSDMVNEIKDRMERWNTETDFLKVSDLIQQILYHDDYPEMLKKRAISGLFSIALAINHKIYTNNITNNTELLKALFEAPMEKNHLYGLNIINFITAKEVVKFDFSDLIIHECYIDTYPSFWKCTFNSATKFIEPTLLNIPPLDSVEVTIPKENFINPNWDDDFKLQFEKEALKSKNFQENVIYILKSFFKKLHSSGKFDKQTLDWLRIQYSRIDQKYFDFKKFTKVLKDAGIIEEMFISDREKVEITDKYKADVSKFINEGSMPPVIQHCINELLKIAEQK